jgi:putative aldouronate transport system substrate-binding protein
MKGGIEAEWDGYINDIKKIGYEEYVKIIQTAYDRQMGNK